MSEREEAIITRLTKAEKQAIVDSAKLSDRSVESYIRTLARKDRANEKRRIVKRKDRVSK